jgi:hypothetical protein
MVRTSARTIKQLEREIARLRQRLAGDERDAGPAGFLGGFVLGALAGGVLALIFTPQAGDQTRGQLRGAGDAILLRGRVSEPDAPSALVEAPATASTPMPLSEAAPPEQPDEVAALDDTAVDASAPQAEDTSPANQVMASPAPPAPTSAAEPTTEEQPAAQLPSSLPGEGGHCPYTHPIKGNKSSSGELIYHLPGTRFYDRTNPEVCFATEADAWTAGFRAAKG